MIPYEQYEQYRHGKYYPSNYTPPQTRQNSLNDSRCPPSAFASVQQPTGWVRNSNNTNNSVLTVPTAKLGRPEREEMPTEQEHFRSWVPVSLASLPPQHKILQDLNDHCRVTHAHSNATVHATLVNFARTHSVTDHLWGKWCDTYGNADNSRMTLGVFPGFMGRGTVTFEALDLVTGLSVEKHAVVRENNVTLDWKWE